MGNFVNDLRGAARMLRKDLAFTSMVALTLGIGIAANTALFSIVNGVLLNPLPFPRPDQLLTFYESKPNFEKGSLSYPNFLDWRKENHAFQAMAVYRQEGFTLTSMGDAESLNGEMISANFFTLLGVNPIIGRGFKAEEDRIGNPQVALISAGLWSRRFGSSPGVLGKALLLNGDSYTVVGVIPASFHLPIQNFADNEIFVSIGQSRSPRLLDRKLSWGIDGIARLKADITLERARADMAQVTHDLSAAYPDANRGIGATLVSLEEAITGRIRPVLLLLLGAVFFVLLIGSVNVASLLLARSAKRAREFAIRVAIGATQAQIVRQLLTESVLLGLVSGALGLILSTWGTQAALARLPAALPRAEQVGLDFRVLFFTTALSLACGLLLGLVPAWKTARPNFYGTLKDGGRSATSLHHRTHGFLVVSEIAFALILLVGAGLMIRSLALLWTVNPGFDTQGVLLFGTALPPEAVHDDPAAIRARLQQLNGQLETVPGVAGASLSWGATPILGEDDVQFWTAGQPKPLTDNDMSWSLDYIVMPHYLKVMGIPLLHGRFFTSHDDEHAHSIAVVDEVFARKFFPHEDAIGKHLNLASYNLQPEIVGIVGHVKQWGLDTDTTNPLRAQIYLPLLQIPDANMARMAQGVGVVLRTSGSPAALTPTIHRILARQGQKIPMSAPTTMQEVIQESLNARRFSTILLEAFAAVAVLLAAIGLYGVISYVAAQQTHEIGIRLALGAQRNDVMGVIMMRGMRLTLAGVTVGLAGAFGLTRLLSNLLFGISPTDPLTFLSVTILLLTVALCASFIPARRAMSVDPVVALRQA